MSVGGKLSCWVYLVLGVKPRLFSAVPSRGVPVYTFVFAFAYVSSALPVVWVRFFSVATRTARFSPLLLLARTLIVRWCKIFLDFLFFFFEVLFVVAWGDGFNVGHAWTWLKKFVFRSVERFFFWRDTKNNFGSNERNRLHTKMILTDELVNFLWILKITICAQNNCFWSSFREDNQLFVCIVSVVLFVCLSRKIHGQKCKLQGIRGKLVVLRLIWAWRTQCILFSFL